MKKLRDAIKDGQMKKYDMQRTMRPSWGLGGLGGFGLGAGAAPSLGAGAAAPSPSAAPASKIPDKGQRNFFPLLPQHQATQAYFDGVQGKVADKYKDQPEVVELGNTMGEKRQKYSEDHPDADSRTVLHRMQSSDSWDQFKAAADGKITPKLARELPSESVGPFVHSLTAPDKRPQTLKQAGYAASAAFGGLATQTMFGEVTDEDRARVPHE